MVVMFPAFELIGLAMRLSVAIFWHTLRIIMKMIAGLYNVPFFFIHLNFLRKKKKKKRKEKKKK